MTTAVLNTVNPKGNLQDCQSSTCQPGTKFAGRVHVCMYMFSSSQGHVDLACVSFGQYGVDLFLFPWSPPRRT